MEGEEGAAVVSTAEIDTSAPFGSVKEAVMLFGERVLATQVYACTKLKEMQLDDTTEFEHEEASNELAETKQHLRKAREDSMKMAKSLFSLQEELQQTKIELQKLKNVRESDRHMILDLETLEDIKFVEDDHEAINRDEEMMQRKKYVRFANPPCVAQLSVPITSHHDQDELQRQSSNKMKKKKQIIPFIKGIFSKKR